MVINNIRKKRLADVISFIQNGLTRKQILERIIEQYNVSVAAIDIDIRKAKQIIKIEQAGLEELRVSTMSEVFVDSVKSAILSDLEIEAVLCKIIVGEYEIEEMIKGQPVLRSVLPSEIIQAARALYLKRGSNAPTKIANTDTKGNDILNLVFTQDTECLPIAIDAKAS